MSHNHTDKTLSPVPSTPENETEVVVEKQSFIQRRIVTPIKNHPKVAAAIGGGLLLVAGAAYAGRATAPDATDVQFTDQENSELEALVAEAEDTTVA